VDFNPRYNGSAVAGTVRTWHDWQAEAPAAEAPDRGASH